MRYGSRLGVNFGNIFFGVTITPIPIYEIDKKLTFGVALNATFNNQKKIYKSTILGGRLIGLYNILEEVQLSAEFEKLNVNIKYSQRKLLVICTIF